MPNDLVKHIQQIELFAELRRDDLKAVANLVRREKYEAGELVCRQGENGHSVYIVESGELRVLHIDAQGIEHEVDTLEPGEHFGETSLLLGEPRDATVEAIEDTVLLRLHRDEFDPLQDERPWMRNRLQMRPDVAQKHRVRRLRFKWQDPDEVVVVSEHRHNALLVRTLLVPGLLVVAIVVGCGYWYSQSASIRSLICAFDLCLIPLGLSLYLAVDHLDDIYIVTNKRVVRREQTPFGRESRVEAPLRTIQDIQESRIGPWARAFDFGNLIIETAGERGHVAFSEVSNPGSIREIIFEQRERMAAGVKVAERAAIRDDMRRYFDRQYRRGEAPAPTPAADDKRRRARTLEALRVPLHVFRYFLPALRYEEGNTITWRKHWIALIKPVALPTLLILVASVAAVLVLTLGPWRTLPVAIGYGIVIAILFPWWLWRFDDWQNDIYQVTFTRIIDVERLPLFQREERREASLGMIQNISLEVPSFLGRVLNYGSVTIETAGAGAFTFDLVKDPSGVQAEIFRRMEAFQKRQDQQAAERRRYEMLDWFAVYDRMRRSSSSAARPPIPRQQET